jgi:GAF domain
MPTMDLAPERNYPALFLALEGVLDALFDGRAEEQALEQSFASATEGFGAQKAVLLALVPEGRRRAVAHKGLADYEVIACEAGNSVPGVSTSRIQESIDSGQIVLVQDAAQLRGARKTGALEGRPYSVLCAPIVDPFRGRPVAVLYLQNEGLKNAFGEADWAWMHVYARALGRAVAAINRSRAQ